MNQLLLRQRKSTALTQKAVMEQMTSLCEHLVASSKLEKLKKRRVSVQDIYRHSDPGQGIPWHRFDATDRGKWKTDICVNMIGTHYVSLAFLGIVVVSVVINIKSNKQH